MWYGIRFGIRFRDQIWRCARFNLVAHQIEPCVYFYLTFNQNKLITVQQKEIFPFTDSADWRIYLKLDDEMDKKIDVTAILFLLVQNRKQTQTEPWLDQALMDSAYRRATPNICMCNINNVDHCILKYILIC